MIGLCLGVSPLVAASGEDPVETGLADIVIEVHRSADQVAPEGVYFTTRVSGFDVAPQAVEQEYDPAFHEVSYAWSLGDGGTYDVPQKLHQAHRDKSVRYTPHIAHVFETPGTHSVTVTALDASGNMATDTVEIAVGNPEVVYAGAQTLAVAADGDFTSMNLPAGYQEFASFKAALEAYENLSAPGRMVLKGGDVWTVENQYLRTGLPNFRLCSKGGTGTPAVLYAGMAAHFILRPQGGYDRGAVLEHIKLQSDWDSTIEGPQVGTQPPKGFIHSEASFTVLHNCKGEGLNLMASAEALTNKVGDSFLIISECDITNFQDFGCYHAKYDDGYFAVIGSRIVQHPEAMMGGGAKSAYYPTNDHGPCRYQNIKQFIWDANESFSRNGWDGSAPPSAVQSNIRMHSYGPNYRGCVTRSVLEASDTIISLSTVNGNGNSEVANNIIAMNQFTGYARTSRMINVEHSGCSIYNNVFTQPEYDSTDGSKFNGGIYAGFQIGYGKTANEIARAAPIRVFSNTFAFLFTDNALGSKGRAVEHHARKPLWGLFSDVLDENNLTYRPNTTTVLDGGGALDLAPLWPPHFLGYKWQANAVAGARGSIAAGTTVTINFTHPDIGTYSIVKTANANGGWGMSYAGGSTPNAADLVAYGAKPVEDEQLTIDAGSATAPDTIASYAPLLGNINIGAAVPGRFNPRDLFGKIRPPRPSTGASEPA
ncbi:PKD domain-containing protein [Litoreibacter meonggei]|uniref:PKD domain-containing protein n=1 Tax=Litoreibacter meonggei TaxID=1049199 RepID=A0A497VDG3_9RHOB|nr:PKD domain-containing protein [Litoreibacter meonggei]RLJ36209.1 PKD domain-containing protein [Litoreibacter meonggei]